MLEFSDESDLDLGWDGMVMRMQGDEEHLCR